MGISKEQLQAIIGGKARDLCSPQADSMLNEVQRINNQGGFVDDDPSNYDGDADYFDSLYTNSVGGGGNRAYNGDIKFSAEAASKSRLDEKIKQSLINNPIDRSSLDPMSRSVLDDMDIKPKPRRTIQENHVVTQQSGVDYSIIKAIVNECLNEYFSKQPLNESATLSTIGLKQGAIKIVDSKGNVFSAKLEKLGNTNNK